MEQLSGEKAEIASQSEGEAWTETAQQAVEWARDRWAQIDNQTRAFVKQHPVGSLLGAAAVGYLAARLWGRR